MNCAGAGGESYQIKLETNSNISASTILMGRRGGGRSGLYAASPKLKRTKYGGGAAGAFTDLEASYVCCCDAWPHKYACRRWTNFTSVHSKLINLIIQRNIVLETQEKSGQVGQRKATGEDLDLINSLSICILRFS